MDQRIQWKIYFILQIPPVCHRTCIPLFLHHLLFHHTKDLFSLLSPFVCAGGCKIMFWWNFPVSNFPPVSVPSGPPLSIPCYSFVRCGNTSPCLPHVRAHPSPHMCEWCSDGQSEYALILELWPLLHVRPYTEISPDQRGCRNAKSSSRLLQWLDY